MLAQRNADAQEKPSTGIKRNSTRRASRPEDSQPIESRDGVDVSALNKRIAQLEKENHSLRQQLARMSTGASGPERSSADSVREHRHNFFKYSNVRRY